MKKPNQELFRIVRFAIRYPGWHTYGSNVRKHVYRAGELGFLEINRETKQFRLLLSDQKGNGIQVHWHNPWDNAVPVPIEELAECHGGLHQLCRSSSGSFILTKEKILEGWRSNGNKLDAYILPQPGDLYSMGIRYGDKDNEYLSPYGDQNKLKALLDKYK